MKMFFRKAFYRNFLVSCFGMFVFGFVDNFILVLAGEAIDNSLAQTFGFSTMASAGIGNAISDSVGILAGGIIGTIVYNLFGDVDNKNFSKNMVVFSQTIGIFLGCLVGMFPLLFI